MITLNQLIEELKLGLLRKPYQQGLLNDELLVLEGESALKRFGKLTKELKEAVIKAKKGKALLPDDFYSIRYMLLCKPKGYHITEGTEGDLIKSNIWKEEIRYNDDWFACDPCLKEERNTLVVENFYYRENKAEMYYHKDKPFRFDSTFINSVACSNDCLNRAVKHSPYTASINGNTLNINMKEADLYIQYYGVPTNEEGELVIPDSEKGTIVDFVKSYIAYKTFEILTFNQEGDYASAYTVKKQESDALFRKSFGELSNNAVNNTSIKKYMNHLYYRRKQQEVV